MVTRGRVTRGRGRGDVPEGSRGRGRGETRPPLGSPPTTSSPPEANNSRDFASPIPTPSPELPSASTGNVPDSVESTVSQVGVDRRKVIVVEENGTRFGPGDVTRSIMSSVFGRMPFADERWRDYSADVKEELFKEFMEKYRFESDNDRKMARQVWEKTCMDRYLNILTKHRIKALNKLKTEDNSKLKGHGPAGMRAEVWDGLVDIWSTLEWQRKSEAAKRNRAAAPDAMLHTGGSISFSAHKRKMEAELNQKVSFRDVYHKTHKKKNGEFVSERSKHFVENLDMALLDKYGEDASYPEVDSNLWLDVAGPSKKGRIHGLGHGLQLSTVSLISPTLACSTTSITTHAIPQSQLDEAVSRAMATFWSTQLAPMWQGIISQGNQASNLPPTRSSQGEECASDAANDDADLGA